jgi:uncharacterized protein involved in exopolysaccharide biosynthesis
MATPGKSDESESREGSRPPSRDREIVYVASGTAPPTYEDDRISLREMSSGLWRGRWIIVALTVVCAVGSIVYSLMATEIYRAEVLLAPAEEQTAPMLGGQLGGLAALAGVAVGGGNDVQPLAVLRSRDFARAFIEDFDLLPVFFADDWDAGNGVWLVDDPADAPDVRDGITYFHQNVLAVSEERTTGLVTIAIEWSDPEVAAGWADVIVRRLNDRLRERALAEAETNVAYLRQEMANSSLVTMQQSIGQLLQSELQKLMLARGNEEFAFKIVDPAMPPKQRARPRRTLIVIIGTTLGALLGAFVVLVAGSGRRGDDA